MNFIIDLKTNYSEPFYYAKQKKIYVPCVRNVKYAYKVIKEKYDFQFKIEGRNEIITELVVKVMR